MARKLSKRMSIVTLTQDHANPFRGCGAFGCLDICSSSLYRNTLDPSTLIPYLPFFPQVWVLALPDLISIEINDTFPFQNCKVNTFRNQHVFFFFFGNLARRAGIFPQEIILGSFPACHVRPSDSFLSLQLKT